MSSTNLNIRTDKEIKVAAEAIYNELGLTLTTAVNMFLRQTIRDNGIPFELKLKPNEVTMHAIIEGREIASDPTVKGYKTMEEMREALENEV